MIADKVFCCHGGLSPSLKSINQIRDIERPVFDIPDVGLLCDLIWADPTTECSGFKESDRGLSYLFGADVVGNSWPPDFVQSGQGFV